MDFKEFLKKYGYSDNEFCKKFHTKKRTLQNWKYRGCPEQLMNVLVMYEDLKIEYDKLFNDYHKLLIKIFNESGGVDDDETNNKNATSRCSKNP